MYDEIFFITTMNFESSIVEMSNTTLRFFSRNFHATINVTDIPESKYLQLTISHLKRVK